tara:strand:+ start:337 stop:483 length:147 start_codon:yes stop_codon:yes gene_type:complete
MNELNEKLKHEDSLDFEKLDEVFGADYQSFEEFKKALRETNEELKNNK